MIISIVDTFNSVLQGIMFLCTINYCLKAGYDKKKSKLILYIIVFWGLVTISYKIVGNSSLNVLITHSISLLIPLFLLKGDFIGNIVSHTIIYFSIGINLLICSNIFYGFIMPKLSDELVGIGIIVCLYLPQIIMAAIILMNLDKVYKVYRTIRAKDLSVVCFVILSLIIDFISSFNIIIHGKDNPYFVNLMFFLLSLFLVAITIYFAKSEKKAKEIHKLNNMLDEKILELKKVKHDYGSQISYLYELHLMQKHDQLGKMLKNIIDGHNDFEEQIVVSNLSDSKIQAIINGIETKDVNVIIDEQISVEELPFNELELQRVISNIVRNGYYGYEWERNLNYKSII